MVKPYGDTRYSDIRSLVAGNAAEACLRLDGIYDIDVFIWETMEVMIEKNRLIKRLMASPGEFIAGLVNEYGASEYLKWRHDTEQLIVLKQIVDQQG